MKFKRCIPCLLFFLLLLMGCGEGYTPKPRGFFRIDLPEKEYRMFDSVYPYEFAYPVYGILSEDPQDETHDRLRRFNINYPALNATIHMTYVPLQNVGLDTLIGEAADFVYKHVTKATQISKTPVIYPEHAVYGTLFNIRGKNVASACQFYVTDSLNHFLRGSLYFNASPDNDSLKPVVDFLKEDIDYMLKTLRWK